MVRYVELDKDVSALELAGPDIGSATDKLNARWDPAKQPSASLWREHWAAFLAGATFALTLFLAWTSFRGFASFRPRPLLEQTLHNSAELRASIPTLHLIGDSTMAIEGVAIADPSRGWGEYVYPYVDMPVNNKALSGRSARTYTTEGDWERAKAFFRKGDVVIIELGLNDEGDPTHDGYHRSDLNSDFINSTVAVEKFGKQEIVHTYEYYVTKWIADVRAAGAVPIIASHICLNWWAENNTRLDGCRGLYSFYASQTAKHTNTTFVHHNYATRKLYENLGYDAVQPFYPNREHGDIFHLSKTGGQAVAKAFFEALACLLDSEGYQALRPHLSARAKVLEPLCAPDVT